MMGGRNTISMHTVCEDSLLASPLIIDLVVIAEFFSRVQYRTSGEKEFNGFHPVLSILSYWLKAPLSRPGRDPVNGLGKQRAALENILRALLGLAPNNEMKYVSQLNLLTVGSRKGAGDGLYNRSYVFVQGYLFQFSSLYVVKN
jgi:myo-inositol-1-phosphate synthase